MPPRPRHSRISNCGNNFAISDTGAGGGLETAGTCGSVSPVTSVWVARFKTTRQRGQSPSGASGGSGAPQRLQLGKVSLITCYLRKSGGLLHGFGYALKTVSKY